jgi:hypothetical protein
VWVRVPPVLPSKVLQKNTLTISGLPNNLLNMDITNPKTLRTLQYAINLILANWDDEVENDLVLEGITIEHVEKVGEWLDNKVEEDTL